MEKKEGIPEVDYVRLNELLWELVAVWLETRAFYYESIVGYEFIREKVETGQVESRLSALGSEIDSESFQDSRFIKYEDLLPGLDPSVLDHNMQQGILKARNTLGGGNYRTLAQSCVISLYTYWEEYFRKEYLIAKGRLSRQEKAEDVINEVSREHASHPTWGDLNKFRNDIIHHRGIAGSNVARCEILTWFEPGDTIDIDMAKMRIIFGTVLTYLNHLDGECVRPQRFKFRKRNSKL